MENRFRDEVSDQVKSALLLDSLWNGWADIAKAHMKMMRNEHKPGNMAVLVQAKRPGMRTIEDATEA